MTRRRRQPPRQEQGWRYLPEPAPSAEELIARAALPPEGWLATLGRAMDVDEMMNAMARRGLYAAWSPVENVPEEDLCRWGLR